MGGGAPPLADDAWQAQDFTRRSKKVSTTRRMTRWLGNILEILWNSGHRPLTKSCFQSVMFSRQYARYPPDHISCSTAVLGCVGCTQGTCCELFFKDAQTPWRICFTSLFACEEWLVCFVCLWRCGFLLGCIAKPKPAQEILWITNITLRPWLGFPPEKWQKNVYCSIHLDVGFFLFSFIPCKVRNQRWAKSSITGTSQNRQLTVGWLKMHWPLLQLFFFVHLFSKDVALSIFFDAEGQDFKRQILCW